MVTDEMRPAPLRLTRRGRAVVLGLLVVLASLASAVLFATASRAENLPSGAPLPTMVVQPDDTLWGIAARVLSGRDLHASVAELRRLNDLGDGVIQPGQTLLLPRGR